MITYFQFMASLFFNPFTEDSEGGNFEDFFLNLSFILKLPIFQYSPVNCKDITIKRKRIKEPWAKNRTVQNNITKTSFKTCIVKHCIAY